jgi:hypothetical protein
MNVQRRASPWLRLAVTGVVLITAASCTATPAAAHPHHHAAAPTMAHSPTVTVRAGKYAITLVPVSAPGLGCTQTAQVVGYPVPCPAVLPPVVLGDYQGCLSAHQTHKWFMYAWVRGCGGPPQG